MNAKRIYLDYASAAPLRHSVKSAISELFDGAIGDPSRIYFEGVLARDIIENARLVVSEFAGVSPRQFIFTASVTEAASLSIYSALSKNPGGTILVSEVEHSGIKKACVSFAKLFKSEVRFLDVKSDGSIKVDELENYLKTARSRGEKLALIALQWANQEVGTLQPVKDVSVLAQSHEVPLLIDAAQVFGLMEFNLKDINADYICVSSIKMGGPPGIAGLIVSGLRKINPLFFGQQERARRGGLENMIGIVGFAAACKELSKTNAVVSLAENNQKLTQLAHKMLKDIDGIEFYGNLANKVPHILSFGLDNLEAEGCLIALDQHGISIHSGSSCSSEGLEESDVLKAMGISQTKPIRLSVGWNSKDQDIEIFVQTFIEVVYSLRKLVTNY